jgi:hypothetical protein
MLIQFISILKCRKEELKIKVFIKDNYITSKDLTNDMLLVYLGLRQIIRLNTNSYFISLGLLSYQLIGKQIASQTITTAILSGIHEMIKKKYVISTEKSNDRRSNEWILNLKKLQIDKIKNKEEKEFYTSIESDIIKNILISDIKEKLSILRFYCYLMTTVSKTGEKSGVGFTSYEDMALTTGICRQTISKYMDKLETEKIIHIYRSTDAILLQPNVLREIPNTYGDISNKNKIISVGKIHEDSFGENAKRVRSSKFSSTRSAAAKYNIIINDLNTTGEIRYDYDILKEIYETLLEYNKRYKNDIKESKGLSIFSNYDFYQGEY